MNEYVKSENSIEKPQGIMAYKRRLDITEPPYNAVGDGKTINTKAIQSALNDCKNGETVYIPEGVFLTGSLDMKSDTELYIDKGGVLKGSLDMADYLPKSIARFEGVERLCYRPLIRIGVMDKYGEPTTGNVKICGGGTILGGGKILADKIIAREKSTICGISHSDEYECDDTVAGRSRPFLVDICNCDGVVIENTEIKDGPAWNLHIVYSKNVTVRSCKISSKGIWNGDGIDPDSSENVTICDCEFDTHDDSIAIKSGKNPEGNKINRPSRNIYIRSCCGKNGISIGSEMSGGVDGVTIEDCDFSDSYSGVWVRTTKKRGGYVRNLTVRNCMLTNIRISGAVDFNNDGESASELPIVENCSFSNVKLSGISTDGFGITKKIEHISVCGFEGNPERFKNMEFDNVSAMNDEEVRREFRNVENVLFEGEKIK